jgi:hypothetical protein
MHALSAALCFFVLASRGTVAILYNTYQRLTVPDDSACALNITFGAPFGNITASRMLAIPDGPLKSAVRGSQSKPCPVD